jgi:hypothetical protein
MNYRLKRLSFIKKASLTFVGLSLMLVMMPLQGEAEEEWGARPLSEKYRPGRKWIKNFATTPDVIAKGSIADAIESCDDVVGAEKHCVIGISNTASGLPLEIFRSNTKLIGVDNMLPLTTPKNTSFIYIGENTKQVIIENLNLKGHKAGDNEITAIFVEGKNIHNIFINNNKIHDFDSDQDAHGIAIYGSGKTEKQAIRNIIIEGNDVFDMRTGSSESIVVNGNVMFWEIKNNIINNINNIAIDAVGGEGTSPTRTKEGCILPGIEDAARYGFIENNMVTRMSTKGNPAYDNAETWAAAIYIDGAHNVKITNNIVKNAPWAYMLGAENCITTQHISMTKNKATGSTYGDLYIGGYSKSGYKQDKKINCNPKTSKDENEGHGNIEHITVKNNMLLSSGISEKTVAIEYRTTYAIIIESTVKAINAQGDGSAQKDNNAIRIEE